MKTLFGERKSVKTLAFILALALILPLLPVMSVVGAEASETINSVLFKNAVDGSGGRDTWADVYFTSPDGTIDIAALLATSTSQNSQKWSSNQTVDLSKKTDGGARNAELTFNSEMSSNRPKRSLQFAIAPDTSKLSEYVIHLSYTDASDQPKDVELSPVNGLYTIDVVTHASKDGKYTVQAEAPTPTHTLTFPTRAQAKTNNYTISMDGKACYGDVEVTEGKEVEFTVTPTNPTDVPSVLVFWADGTETTPAQEKVSGAYKYTISKDVIKKDGEVLIDLYAAVSITYVAEVGSDANSFTVKAKEGSAYSVSYGTENFEFSVTPASGYSIVSVTVDGTTVTSTEADGYYKITKKITAPVTVRVATKAITSSIEIKGDGEDGLAPKDVTVNGLPSSVPYNGTVTFTVTVPTGYKVPTVKYSIEGAKDRTDVEITPDANGTYTITNVTGKLEITVGKTAKQNFTITYPTSRNHYKINPESATSSKEYGDPLTVIVTPNAGYKVSSIVAYNTNTNAEVKRSTNSTTLDISSVTTNLTIEVTVTPITITLQLVNRPAALKESSYSFSADTYSTLFSSESGEVVSEQLESTLETLAGTNSIETRVGFSKVENDFIKSEGKVGNSDSTIVVTFNWKVDPSQLFTVTTTVSYSSAEHKLIFTSNLGVNPNADEAAKIEYANVKVTRYGIFYANSNTTLTADSDLITKAATYAQNEKQKSDFEVSDKNSQLTTNEGRVFFYGYKSKTDHINTYVQEFSGDLTRKSRSGLAWFEVSIGGNEYVIAGAGIGYSVS